MSIINNKGIKSPELKASIVEPILLRCGSKVSFDILALAIQQNFQISFIDLKIYLFYLIDYEVISYNGQEQMFTIEGGGLDLLDLINMEKIQEKVDIGDIRIILEYT
jgi:hypothetical protein